MDDDGDQARAQAPGEGQTQGAAAQSDLSTGRDGCSSTSFPDGRTWQGTATGERQSCASASHLPCQDIQFSTLNDIS